MNRNEKIYPIYRMFGYDYLFYLAISFLFLTVTKGLSVGQVMYLSAFASIFIAVFQIPTNYIVEKIGLKKSMVLGGLLWIVYILIIMLGSNFFIFVLAEAVYSLGACLKGLSETQMLYATLKENKKKHRYAEIEGRGMSLYYYFEAVTSVFVGMLFLINNYIPMILTLTFSIVAFILSLAFEDIKDYMLEKSSLKQYLKGVKLIMKSKRVISLFIYSFTMAGIIRVVETLQKSTIVELEVSPTEYSLIFAVVTFCIGIGSSIQKRIEEVSKRKTLATVGYSYIILIIVLGVINILIPDKNIALIFSVIILLTQNLIAGTYRISIKKYLNNFTTSLIRGKILSVFYIFESIGKAIMLFLCGMLIDKTTTNMTSIIVGTLGLIIITIIVKYMKTRVGLEARQYNKEEIFGMEIKSE